MSEALIKAITSMDEEKSLALTRELLKNGADPLELLDHCRHAMEIVGDKFAEGIFFIPELMMAGEILSQISEITKEKIGAQETAQTRKRGKFLIGTVEGDIHDIGKNIVTFIMDINGFEVIDIGVDVKPDTFVQAVQEHQPDIVGLCGLLTLAIEPMKKTVAAFETAGLRDSLKIMIGGGAITEEIKDYAQADAYGKDAVAAVNIAKAWMEG